jgi:hypothetical protein
VTEHWTDALNMSDLVLLHKFISRHDKQHGGYERHAFSEMVLDPAREIIQVTPTVDVWALLKNYDRSSGYMHKMRLRPLRDMPLLIHNKDTHVKMLAKWRLEIGK